MSPGAQGISGAVVTALVGGALDALGVRMGWFRRRNWVALVIVPLCIGALIYTSAAR